MAGCEGCALPANGYPVQRAVAETFVKRGGSFPGGRGGTLTRPYSLWHRRNYPNNGSSRILFFNAARAEGVSNLDQASQLPANYLFAIHTVRIGFLYGIDVDGLRSTVSSTVTNTALSGALSDVPWQATEISRELLEQGAVTLKIGEQVIFEEFGLTTFPQGGAMVPMGAMALANTAADGQQSGNIANGSPIMCNFYPMVSPFPLVAVQQFHVEISWKTAVSFRQATIGPLSGETAGNPAGTLMVKLCGEYFSPASA